VTQNKQKEYAAPQQKQNEPHFVLALPRVESVPDLWNPQGQLVQLLPSDEVTHGV
jgi:hypothetical protein